MKFCPYYRDCTISADCERKLTRSRAARFASQGKVEIYDEKPICLTDVAQSKLRKEK